MKWFLVEFIFQILIVELLAAQRKVIMERERSLRSQNAKQPSHDRADYFWHVFNGTESEVPETEYEPLPDFIDLGNEPFPPLEQTSSGIDVALLTNKELLCALRNAVNPTLQGFVPVSHPAGIRLAHYGKCAVVSSSGVLTLHSHGANIDSADVVMRFNMAPIAGWEGHVGRKDDIRLVNERVLDEWVNGLNLEFLSENVTYATTCTVCNVGTAHTVSPTTFAARQHLLVDLHPHIELFASDLQLESSLERFFQEFYGIEQSSAGVTSGAVGMALALSLCDEVHAYGMAASASQDLNFVPYNYWQLDPEHDTPGWHRSFTAEKSLWRRLARNPVSDIDATDVAQIMGFSDLKCPVQ